MPHDLKVPQIWVRAHKHIMSGDEIMVDYGHEMFDYINDQYKCKCTKCLSMTF